MNQKTWDKWVNRRVRLKSDPNGPVGLIVDKGTTPGWWLVEWPDGSRKQYALRHLVIVE